MKRMEKQFEETVRKNHFRRHNREKIFQETVDTILDTILINPMH